MDLVAQTAPWSPAGVVGSLLIHAIGPLAAAGLVDRSGRRNGVLRRSRRICWWLGVTTLTLAVSPPVDALAHTSFLWHMIQHLVIVLIGAPALVGARPDLLLLRALPRRTRDRVARLLVAAVPRRWLAPSLALTGFLGWLWLTHMTSIYDRTLTSPPLHVVEHTLYLVTAMAFWVPFVTRTSRSELARIVTPLVVTLIAMPASSTLAFVLLNAKEPRYVEYSLSDQRAGAAAMWIGMSVAMLGAALVVIGRGMPPRGPWPGPDGERR